MSETLKFVDGQPCWIDIATPDSEKRLAFCEFLTELFGWDFEMGEADSGFYSLAHSDGHPVAGVMEMAGVPSYWTTYLATSDINKSVQSISSHGGGLVTGPMQVFEMGHMALCHDAVGAIVGLWQAIEFSGFGKYDENNSPAWFDVQSENPQRAATFYHEAFGSTIVPMSDSEHSMIGTPEAQWFSVSPQPAPMPASWNPVIRVDLLSRISGELKRLGATILMNDMPVPGGKIVVFADPVVHAPLICFEAD